MLGFFITTDKESAFQTELKYHEMQRDSNSFDLHKMDKEIEGFKLELSESRKKCECTDMEMDDVTQLKDKGLFIMKNFQRKYENANKELKDIHYNYTKCVSKVNSRQEIAYQEINFLTLQRDNLKKELTELKKIADENSKKLVQIRKIITGQEKKNVALIRKLKRIMERSNITQDLKERINGALCDPRITKTNVSNENIE